MAQPTPSEHPGDLGVLLPFPNSTPADVEPGADRHTDIEPAPPVFDAEITDDEPRRATRTIATVPGRIRQAKTVVIRRGRAVRHHRVTSTAAMHGGHTLTGLRKALRGWYRWIQVVEHREDKIAHAPVRGGAAERVLVLRRWRISMSTAPTVAIAVTEYLGAVPPAATAGGVAVLLGAAWLAGRPRKATAEGAVSENGQDITVYPLADAHNPTQAMECLRRALLSVKVPVVPLSAVAKPWGWEVLVQLVGGTGKKPAHVIKEIEALETALDVRQNGLLAQPHTDRRARITLRCIESDPYAKMPPLPVYKPGSRSISDRIAVAMRLDAIEVGAAFQATHAIILAASGGGKSILIRVIVDGLGACHDVILWDLDPSGVGQEAQKCLFRRRALSPVDCETSLGFALSIAEARTRLLGKLGMGDEWQPSSEHPALVIVLDEFPRLTKDAKDLAVSLLRVARKAGVVLVFASQSAKKDTLGDSVAAEVAFKAGGPGLAAYQSRLLFGDNCISEGWNPGAFKPKRAGRLNDAGTFFFEGLAEGDEPIPSRALFLSNPEAAARAARCRTVGAPAWDADTLKMAGLDAAELDSVTDPLSAAEAQRAAHEQDMATLPEPWQQIADYLDGDLGDPDGRAFVPSAELADALGVSARKLSEDVKAHLKPLVGRVEDEDGEERQVRGYKIADIRDVLDKLSGQPVTTGSPDPSQAG